MIPIPNKGIFKQSNKSDLFGNISKTKSINFDEEGYLKLSNRTVSLLNSTDDTNFNIPVSFGRYTNGSFFVATVETPYILTLSDTQSSISEDVDDGDDPHPSLDFVTSGKWWRNLWHITNNTKLYYKTLSNGNWTDTGITLTTDKLHPLEHFEKSNTLMVGNGNTVKQLDSSYTTTSLAQLTLSSDYEVSSLAYNNNTLGIGTRLSSTIEGQNKEAMFFVWDGSESSANSGYGVGSDSVITVFPYKSSFGVLTRAGQLLYFNGGGFEKLDSFPVYFKDLIWGNSINIDAYGDIAKVDGDVIYLNIPSEVITNRKDDFDPSMLGGIWCYDPNVGLHHKYSPSISKAQIVYAREADVNISTNLITVFNSFSLPNPPTLPSTGNPVKILDSAVGGISEGTIYYIIKSSSSTFKLASTKQNAIDGVAVDLTSAGVLNIMTLDLKDYGQTRLARTGGIGITGYKQYLYSDLIFGGEYYPSASISDNSHLLISTRGFKNIGYLETSKVLSETIEDNLQKLCIKHRPLGEEDKIIVKYKNKDIYGLPEYANCSVLGKNILSTTSNLSYSLNITEDLECEVVSGSGAGRMVKIQSITYENGTYSIQLEEDIEEFTAGDVCGVVLDNWTYLDEITSTNSSGYKEIALAKNSKWTKFKVVLEGCDTTIEELLIFNKTHI